MITDNIHNYDSLKELEEQLAAEIIQDLSRPGSILLPVGNTYKEIFKKINAHFRDLNNSPHQQAFLSHVDELYPNQSHSFSAELEADLSELVKKLDTRFIKIDPAQPAKFEKFIQDKPPKKIYLGLGKNPENAHLAFIGESYVNNSAAIVELSKEVKEQFKVEQAYTIGTDIFKTKSLVAIIVVAIGKAKAESILYGHSNDETGLGYVFKHYADILQLRIDPELSQALKYKL
jgi:hypothetical protein